MIGKNSLRIGIVGLGRVATATHIPILTLLDDVEITACAETNKQRIARVKEFLSLPAVFYDYHEMYRSKLLDAVYICTPPHIHYDATISALENGLHVLCEKPMGRNLEEAIGMNSVARSNGLILMPGFKIRYNENFQETSEIIGSSLLGNVIQVEATFMTPGPYISWDPKSDWYFEEEEGGVIYDIGVHIVDLLNFLVPHKITDVYAIATQGYYEYKIPTNVSCSFKMDNGITGTIVFGWRSCVDLTKVSIYGTAGAIVAGSKSLDYYNAGTDPKDRIFNHLRNSFCEAKGGFKRVASIFKGSEVSVNDLEQAKAFIRSIKTGSIPPVSGDNAIYAHRVLAGIERSIECGNSVCI